MLPHAILQFTYELRQNVRTRRKDGEEVETETTATVTVALLRLNNSFLAAFNNVIYAKPNDTHHSHCYALPSRSGETGKETKKLHGKSPQNITISS